MSWVKGNTQSKVDTSNKQETTNGTTAQMVKNQFKNEGFDISDDDANAWAKLSDSDRKTKLQLMGGNKNQLDSMNSEDKKAMVKDEINNFGTDPNELNKHLSTTNGEEFTPIINEVVEENNSKNNAVNTKTYDQSYDDLINRNKNRDPNASNNTEDPEADAKRIMEQNGLNVKKYLKEDGSIDYRKLHRAMGWGKALAGIFGAIGSGFAGLGFRDGLSAEQAQKMVDNAGGRYKEVIDTQKGREENKYNDDRELKKLAKTYDLSTENQAALMKYANELQEKYQLNLWDYIGNMDEKKAKKIGNINYAMSGSSITGNKGADAVIGAALSLIPGKSDERCKSFAKRSVFK